MKAPASHLLQAVLAAALGACGGGGGGGARPVVIPDVVAGPYEADCQTLCTRAASDTICTAKHSEFCVARCRASTRELPIACADCLIAAGTKIEGYVNSVDDSYCTVGGPAGLAACATACDDGGGQPAPALETLCQLECAFYVQGPTPLACSADGSADCLADCRATIAARGRICAQCLIDQTIPTRSCFNNDCDCSPSFNDGTTLGCMALCDALAPP